MSSYSKAPALETAGSHQALVSGLPASSIQQPFLSLSTTNIYAPFQTQCNC